MGLILFLMFVLVPVIEIAGFMQIGSLIGFWPTIGIIILTAIAGSMLLRHQGMMVLLKAQEQMRSGEMPLNSMVDGVFLAFAGALLLTPGFFTDTFGLLLFLPPFRRLLAKLLFKKVIASGTSASFESVFTSEGADPRSPNSAPGSLNDGPVIDGTFEEVSPLEEKPSDEDPAEDKDPTTPWAQK